MKWLENLESISEKSIAGKCPICKSDNTDYRLIKINGDYGYGDIWCNDCKSTYHISRMKIDKEKFSE